MKKGLAFALLLAFILAACEKYDRYIEVGTDTECCGIADPMANIPWLREKNHWGRDNAFFGTSYFDVVILRYTNYLTLEDRIVEWTANEPGDVHPWITIYDCAGEYIDEGIYDLQPYYGVNAMQETAPPQSEMGIRDTCGSCPQFFSTHILADTLAQYKVVKL